MKRLWLLNTVMILVALSPFVYLALIWKEIPDIVALHFNVRLEPDRTGSKNDLLLSSGILATVSIGVFFLLKNIHRIDPKRAGTTPSANFTKLAAVTLVFMTALNFMLLLSSLKGAIVFKQFLFPLLGGFFSFLGNYMNNVKPNYFAGFRLPWTLSDDDNWRKTHLVAGKLWFGGGLLIALTGFVIPVSAMIPFFIVIMLLLALIPIIYSYRLFKTKEHTLNK